MKATQALHPSRPSLLFTLTFVLLTLSAGGGAYLAWRTAGQLAMLENHLEHQHQRLQKLIHTVPAPTPENLDAAQRNIATLESQLHQARNALYPGRVSLDPDAAATLRDSPRTPHQILFELQESVDTLRAAAAAHQPPIHLPDDFHFGFEAYTRSGTPPAIEDLSLVSRQHRIVVALVTTLYEARPRRLLSIQCNGVVPHISPVNASSVPSSQEPSDSPHMLTFALTFTGHTHTLRHFLNQLALPAKAPQRLPMNVRQVTITPAVPTAAAPHSKVTDAEALNALLDALSDEDDAVPAAASEPVISENLSQFTLVVE